MQSIIAILGRVKRRIPRREKRRDRLFCVSVGVMVSSEQKYAPDPYPRRRFRKPDEADYIPSFSEEDALKAT